MKLIFATMRSAFAEAWANRRSFWLQLAIMVVNDLVWIVFWLLLFRKVGNIHGWDKHRVLLLFSIVITVSGLSLGVMANARRLGAIAADGRLDPVLTLPVDPLAYLLFRRFDAIMMGDIVTGVILFGIACNPTPQRVVIYVFGSLVGVVVLTSFMVLLSSITFFVGGRGEQADLGFNLVILLASYPIDLFGGVTKFLLFTVVPVGFITGLPAKLVDHFQPGVAAGYVAVAVGLAVAARRVFTAGLRRYRSGSLWVGM